MATITKIRSISNGILATLASIPTGYTRTIVGYNVQEPIVGQSYWFGSLQTTEVLEVIQYLNKEFKIRTRNSTYLIEK